MLYAYVQYGKNDAGTAVRQVITDYAVRQGIPIDGWLSAASLSSCVKKLRAGDTLLMPEICCLGKSLPSVKKIISHCVGKKIKLIIVCDGYVFCDSPDTRMLLSALDMVLAINSKLKSQTMRNRLKQLRREGKVLGRPPGSRNKSIKLGTRKNEIEQMLAQKVSKAEIARRLGVNRMTLYAFLRRISK